jgi:excinuclease ABC subunit C
METNTIFAKNSSTLMAAGAKFKSILSLIPENPGVYQFIDSDGVTIYIGKAKNLRKRVTSYFSKTRREKP